MRRCVTHSAAFLAGAVVATAVGALAEPTGAGGARFRRLDVFAQALSYIENNYVDPVDETALLHGAVDGMVDRLDHFSIFLPPAEYKRLREDTEGRYAGVGISVSTGDDGVPVVTEVLADSPAERAGLEVDDRLVAVAGVATAGSGGGWRGSLRGAVGSRVTIEVERAGWSEPRSFTLVRGRILVPSVTVAQLDHGIAHLRVHQFQQDTTRQVRKALARARKAAGGVLPGVVLDLRGNPGGLFDEAVGVADVFLGGGTIVTVRGRRGQLEQPQAEEAATWADVPIAVLVDGRSASSAEIVAGALQDHGRAVVVGLPSFGKGSVQSLLDLDDGSGLKLTTARYETPAGHTIEGRGIQPDIEVANEADQLEIAYQTLRRLGLSNGTTEK